MKKFFYFLIGCGLILFIIGHVPAFAIVPKEALKENEKIEFCYWSNQSQNWNTNTIKAVLKDGQEKDLCRILTWSLSSYKNAIKFVCENNKLYIYDAGIRKTGDFPFPNEDKTIEEAIFLNESSGNSRKYKHVLEDDEADDDTVQYEAGQTRMELLVNEGKAHLVEYNPRNKAQETVKITERNKKLIQDIFVYDGKINYLADYDKRKQNRIDFLWSKMFGVFFEDTGAYISVGDTILSSTVAGYEPDKGISPLRVKGVVHGKAYYYPSIDGIYAYDLEKKKATLLIPENNTNCSQIKIYQWNHSFYEIKSMIEKLDTLEEGTNRLSGYTEIIEYNAHFKKTGYKKIDMIPETIVFGKKNLILSQSRQQESGATVQEDEQIYKVTSCQLKLDDLSIQKQEEMILEQEPYHTDTLWGYHKEKEEFYTLWDEKNRQVWKDR